MSRCEFCAINTRDSLAAVADMTWAKESANARKPKIYKFDDLYKLAEQNGYEVHILSSFDHPIALTLIAYSH